MSSSPPAPLIRHDFFVAGTDTGVGKTLVACALLRAFANRGLQVAGMKPVAAGARLEGGALVNDDVTALTAASNVAAPAGHVNPYCFAPPVAPHIAAAEAGVTIDLEYLKYAYSALTAFAQCVIVEGAGGFRVPLTPQHDMRDLAMRLGLPIILVVGVRLGCLNHAMLTAESVRSARLRLAGWVANHIDATMEKAAENVHALGQRLDAPLIGRIAYRRNADPVAVARELDLAALQPLQ